MHYNAHTKIVKFLWITTHTQFLKLYGAFRYRLLQKLSQTDKNALRWSYKVRKKFQFLKFYGAFRCPSFKNLVKHRKMHYDACTNIATGFVNSHPDPVFEIVWCIWVSQLKKLSQTYQNMYYDARTKIARRFLNSYSDPVFEIVWCIWVSQLKKVMKH